MLYYVFPGSHPFDISLTDASPDPIKGGIRLAPYMTYNCLREDKGQSGISGDYLRQFWTCPVCNVSLPLTMSERLRHQATCTSGEETEVMFWC